MEHSLDKLIDGLDEMLDTSLLMDGEIGLLIAVREYLAMLRE